LCVIGISFPGFTNSAVKPSFLVLME
jgi:hypothetical protein